LPAEKVLFVCIGNAGRSQMAQAFAERAGFEARSAGSHAESHLHPEVVEVMRELGIDLSDRSPHQLNDDDVEWAELVVTMGCGDACPVLPGKRYVVHIMEADAYAEYSPFVHSGRYNLFGA